MAECRMLQTDRNIIGVDAAAVTMQKELGFVPRLIVIDNMADAECRLYDGSYANPLTTAAQPLDVIPPRCFKIVVYTGQSPRFTLAIAAGAKSGQFVNWILTEDKDYADSYHQQINPVNVEVHIAGSKELLSGSVVTGAAGAPLSAVDTPITEVTIQNPSASAADILVGGAGGQVLEVKPGGWITIPAGNLNLVYVKAASGTPTANYLARR